MYDVIALYLRLSVDDSNPAESGSIANQRALLQAFVTAEPALQDKKTMIFADDGYSGTNFNRPQVQRLLSLARNGGLSCVLVKDLSRFGRNYPEVSHYLDNIFPLLNIRFISVNDNYDSAAHKWQAAPISMAFNAIMHDVYSKDLSAKVRQSYAAKSKQGEYLTGRPPFGFVKSNIHRNKLEVDPEAAAVVRQIFSMAGQGYSCVKIAAFLNSTDVDTPLMYHRRKAADLHCKRIYWTGESIRRILTDERYTGVLITGRRRVTSPGARNVKHLPKDEWIRVCNSHEAIVSHEEYRLAQAVIKFKRKQVAFCSSPTSRLHEGPHRPQQAGGG